MSKDFSESDLYMPIKSFFTEQGFDVKGEVKDCDLVGIKDDIVMVVEMKKIFSLQVIYQALDRLKITNYVYIAIPRPKNIKRTTKMINLLKRLDLGLIYVSMDSPVHTVSVPLNPKDGKKNNKSYRNIVKEFNERTFDSNVGGVSRRKIITAYREQVLKIACIINNFGEHTAKELVKDFGCPKNTHSILYKNYYKWFEKIDRGIYGLSDLGKREIEEEMYKELVKIYSKIERLA